MKRARVLITLLALTSIAVFMMSRIYGSPDPIPMDEIETKAGFVDVSNISARKNLMGKWVVSGVLSSTAKKDTISRLKIRYFFSDGYEELPVDVVLTPSVEESVVFTEKIDKHEDGSFDSLEIIEAY